MSSQTHGLWSSDGTRIERLCFIDVARAVAIVMMLQSHFVGVVLAPAARDLTSPTYLAYVRLRGLTAPLFLTVSGLVFVYFLLGDPTRAWRGVRRGIMLIGLGHLLRFNPAAFGVSLERGLSVMASVHVLPVVGVGLLLLVALHGLHRCTRVPLAWWLVPSGILCFSAAPWLTTQSLAQVPLLARNYLQTADGSVFTLFPWLGYLAFGGVVGVFCRQVADGKRGRIPVAIATVVTGGLAQLYAMRLVYGACRLWPSGACDSLLPTHVWLGRAGLCVSVLGVLMACEPWLRSQTPVLVLRVGRHTLFLFIVHAVVLYGSVTGVGLQAFLRGRMDVPQAALSALLFVSWHVLLVQQWSQWSQRVRTRTNGTPELSVRA